MGIERLFDGVYRVDGRLATLSLAGKIKVYGENHMNIDGKEYRSWNPYRSKLGAAIMNGLRNEHIHNKDSVLYLGAATGTTPSHVSDILGKDGTLYCVELSERNMRELLKVCEHRNNMLPILGDARRTERYFDMVGECDAIYQDVSSPEQAGILLENSKFLKKGGYAYFAIKSQSINIKRPPEHTFKKVLEEVGSVFDVVERVDIEPYHKLHLFAVLRKR